MIFRPTLSALKHRRAIVSWLFVAITLVLPAHGSPVETAERTSVKVLAVGNSFSRDAMSYLPALARAGGKELTMANAYIGGCSLERHARHLREAEADDPAGRAYKGFHDPKTGKKRDVTLLEALEADTWDVVTLQQVSHQSFKPESYHPHIDQLIAAVRTHAPQAEIVIHQTWAYREDHSFFHRNDGFTPEAMYSGLRDTYRSLADDTSFRLIPVGDAFNLARQTPRWTYVPDPGFDFENPPAGKVPDQRTSLNIGWHWVTGKDGNPFFKLDATHANAAGRYLGGATWYLTLFNADILPEAFTPTGLSPEEAADLRAHALTAVQAERIRESAPAATASP